MSTLDVVAGCVARPANFLDVGGGASARVMADGLSVILADPSVRSVLVNVFGGITACDAVAEGIVQALDSVRLTKPLVVRLDGNNAAEGREILSRRDHPLIDLTAFQADPDTELIVLIGEIDGDAEERAAAHISAHVTKPVVGYIAGFTAPEGRTMGHAGAIVSGSTGTAEAKQAALEAAGVAVGSTPSETARLVLARLAART